MQRLLSIAAVTLALAAPAMAQVREQPIRMAGVTFDRFSHGLGGNAPLVPTFRLTSLHESRPGLDLAATLWPQALFAGTLVLQVQAGPSQPFRLGPVTVLVKGGPGAFVTLGGVGPEHMLTPTLSAGIASLITLERRASLRVDLIRHYMFSDGGTIRAWSLGIGLATPLRSR